MKQLFTSTSSHKGIFNQFSETNRVQRGPKTNLIKEIKNCKSINAINNMTETQRNNFLFEEEYKYIGDYRFNPKKLIGSGYSSKVYKAINVKDNRTYAIKAVDLTHYKQLQLQMLQNQIKILKKMVPHPNIIKFYHAAQSQNHLYIVTQYCQKGDLLAFMEKNGTLDEKQALLIFADILRGVQYLQKSGIIHRDIKPGNILYDGKNWKIADFGFSLESKYEVRTKNNVGTPLYMPLESFEDNLYSFQSDIFSVGIILYELLFGITPWQSRDQDSLRRKLNKIGFKVPEQSIISPQIEQLLIKMCQPQKKRRMKRAQFLSLDPANYSFFSPAEKINIRSDLFDKKRPRVNSEKWNPRNNIAITDRLEPLQKFQIYRKNKLDQFASEKIKRSLQQIQQEGQLLIKSLAKIKSACILLNSSNPNDVKNAQSQDNNAIKMLSKTKETNQKILLSLLTFCRFMFYLMKNTQFLDLSKLNRQKIKTILISHALYILKQLLDTQNNWFRLYNFEYYRQTKNYLKIYESFKQYFVKYEKYYEQMTKKVEKSVLRQVNQNIFKFKKEQPTLLSQIFYQKLLEFVAPILRQNNHNLASSIYNNKKKIDGNIKYKLQAIKNFYKYYTILSTLCKDRESYQNFDKQNIEVVKSYHSSKITIEDYINLRKEMKYI